MYNNTFIALIVLLGLGHFQLYGNYFVLGKLLSTTMCHSRTHGHIPTAFKEVFSRLCVSPKTLECVLKKGVLY